MAISLTKNEKVSLEKNSGGLSKVFMGLGWDVAKPGGFLSSLLGSPDTIDLDASCVMLDSNKNIVDTVWFHQLRSKDGSIVHSGDNLTGAGDGDDEVITVELNKLPSNVANLIFVISSFRGQTFDKVDAAFCRLVDATNKQELVKYKLSGKNPYTAQIMARVYKENGIWTMQALGEPANGRTVQDFVDVVKRFV